MKSTTFVVRNVVRDPNGFKPVIAVINTMEDGTSYISSDITCGVGFESDTEALLAGDRAVQMVKTTGRFPNMCAAF